MNLVYEEGMAENGSVGPDYPVCPLLSSMSSMISLFYPYLNLASMLTLRAWLRTDRKVLTIQDIRFDNTHLLYIHT
jgi:hypothetical protein